MIAFTHSDKKIVRTRCCTRHATNGDRCAQVMPCASGGYVVNIVSLGKDDEMVVEFAGAFARESDADEAARVLNDKEMS